VTTSPRWWPAQIAAHLDQALDEVAATFVTFVMNVSSASPDLPVIS